MATIPSVQLFRNSKIKTGRQAAIDALEAQKASVADGGLILARYSEDGTDNGVKTLLGIVRNGGGTNVQLTVIDVEGAAKNVQSAIEKAINDLNKADAEEEGQYVASVSEDKGIITVTRKSLPSFDEKTDSGKAITAITQTNGEVSVKFGGVAAANVSVADEDNIFTATTVEGVLSEIKNSLDNAIGTGGTVEEQITNKINALNSEESGTSTSNHITVGVKQVAGKITSVTVSDSDIASAELLGTINDTKDKATAFGRIAQEAADREAAIEALSTSSTVTLESAAGTESGVLNVYTIKQGTKEVGKINIPKDLVVTSGSVVKGTWDGNTFTEDVSGSGTALKLVIANQTNPVYINTLDLVKDHTGGNGIAISDTNVISVKIDGDSETFLTVETNGIKLSGVQTAINTAAAAAKTKVEKKSDADKITLDSATAADGSVTYTIGQNDIASASDLKNETTNRQNQDNTIEAAVGLNADGNHVQTSGNYTNGATTVVGEIAALDTQLKAVSDTLGTGVSTAEGKTVTEQLQALSGSPIDGKDVTSVYGARAYAKDLVDNLNAEVGSTTGTSKTEAIKIVQAHGKINSITLGAFDCGTYN